METFSVIPEHHQSSPAKMISRDLSDVSQFLSTASTVSSMNVFITQPQQQFQPIAENQDLNSDSSEQPQNFSQAGNLTSSLQILKFFLVQKLSTFLKQKEDVSSPHSVTSRKRAIEEARIIILKKRNQYPFVKKSLKHFVWYRAQRRG